MKIKKEVIHVKSKLFLQHEGNEILLNELERRVKAEWRAEGNLAKDIREMECYVKPEDGLVYYVINEIHTGSIPLYEQ